MDSYTGGEKENTKVEGDIFRKIYNSVSDSINNSSTWATNQAKFNRIRMRVKKKKVYPFIGASDLRQPTAEIKIKKLKSAVSNVILGLRPIVQCNPGPSGNIETAMKIEKFVDHLIIDKMDYKPSAVITIDQTLECGFYLNKPYWRYEENKRELEWNIKDISMEDAMFLFDGNTGIDEVVSYLIDKFEIDTSHKVIDENLIELERVAVEILSASKRVKFTALDVLFDGPDVALINPEKVFVPTTSGYKVQSAEWICHEYEMPLEAIKRCAKNKGWNIEDVEDISSYYGVDNKDLRDRQLDVQEGIDRLNDKGSMVRIWEWYGWCDIDGSGKKTKTCITVAPEFKKIMRKVGLPFDNGKWPFVKYYYELREDRWYAHRGIVEVAEDLIKEIDIQHNMKIDYQSTNINPIKLYRAGMVNPNLLTGAPNQVVPVRGNMPLSDVVLPVNTHNPNVEFSYEKEEQTLLSKIEELIGQVDYTLQSQINRRQPRTLGEVELQNQSANTVFSLDSDMFRNSFSELFHMIWDLWCQYGQDEYEFMYFGQNGWEKIKLSREEIQGEYKFTVRGNDQNSNPNVRLMKAQQIISFITNPVLLQTGVVTVPQIIAGAKRFMQTLDIEGWEQFINMQPNPPQPPPVGETIKPKFKDLTDAEQAQVLGSLGVMPDAQGRMMDKQIELQEHALEMLKG